MAVQNPPEGFTSITPYILVQGAAEAITWYGEHLGATEIMRMPMGDRIGHAEIRIGNAIVMLSDEWPEMNLVGPKTRGGPTASIMVYVDDVDAAFAKAIGGGATEASPVTDQFWGDRMGTIVDPFGHRWLLGTHVEDVSEEEIGRRLAAMQG